MLTWWSWLQEDSPAENFVGWMGGWALSSCPPLPGFLQSPTPGSNNLWAYEPHCGCSCCSSTILCPEIIHQTSTLNLNVQYENKSCWTKWQSTEMCSMILDMHFLCIKQIYFFTPRYNLIQYNRVSITGTISNSTPKLENKSPKLVTIIIDLRTRSGLNIFQLIIWTPKVYEISPETTFSFNIWMLTWIWFFNERLNWEQYEEKFDYHI